MRRLSVEQVLAFHCSPALAGIKPSNLVSFCRKDKDQVFNILNKLNSELNSKQIYFKILCQCPKRILVLVYRKSLLLRHLQTKQVLNYLLDSGYPADASLDLILATLAERITSSSSFPHELGVFLGYPLSDVIGFLTHKGKNYKASGYWKVYDNEQETINLFNRYSRCTTAICKKLEKGFSLVDLFKTA